jgi:general secretion pathway protein N
MSSNDALRNEKGAGVKRVVLWLLAIALSLTGTMLLFFPATWVGALVERQTGGRLTLGDAQGTLWRGSAFIGGAASSNGAVTPLLPGRFEWRLSKLVLIGRVDLELQNAAALSQPLNLRGGWTHWQLSPAALLLPAAGLSGLGAPLNTIAPSGTMRLSWSTLALELDGQTMAVNGKTRLTMTDMASRLSSIRPLGSYAMVLDWQGQRAMVTLSTLKGPLLLDGSGALERGRLRFSGQAQAAQGSEEKLANLLNLLGQRRMNGDKNIIALEFK